jgi:cobalt-zinc-cadmium efflux system outer membrane protein
MKPGSKKVLFAAFTVSIYLFLSLDVLCEETKQSSYSGEPLRLEDLERMALENNPTLHQAAADIRAAEGRKLQAGLYPNPRLGYDGEEISTRDPSEKAFHSFFVEQRIVTAGKLKHSRDIFAQEQRQARAEHEAQRGRVLNDVRLVYYQTLGAQRIVELHQELARIAQEAVDISAQLYNVGQADRPDVLEAEVVAQKVGLDLVNAKSQLELQWQRLANIVGKPDLPRSPLAGNLEASFPEFNQGTITERLLRESPQLRVAEATVERSEAAVRRAKAEPYPDITVRAGYTYGRERGEKESLFLAGISIPLPIFDRNQGNIASALSERNRTKEEKRRIELVLRDRMALTFNEYTTSRQSVEQYQKVILPRAQTAYDLYLKRFKQMAAAYPQVLIAQRNLFQARVEYVRNQVNLWLSVTMIEGFLLTGGLDAPRMNSLDRVKNEKE